MSNVRTNPFGQKEIKSPFGNNPPNNNNNNNIPEQNSTFNPPPKNDSINPPPKSKNNTNTQSNNNPFPNNKRPNEPPPSTPFNQLSNTEDLEGYYSQKNTNKSSQHNYYNPIKSNITNNQYDDYITAKNEFDTKLYKYCCLPEYINTTTNVFPKNSKLLKELSFPIGVTITPLANTNLEIPLINYGDKAIPRCPNNNCRAYLNPFVKWIEGGEKWVCNFCNQINDTEEYYYAQLNNNGERMDIETRTELNCGSYEFITNRDYWKPGRSPNKANFIFLIETSLSSINSGFLSAVIESIKDTINNNAFYNKTEDISISFITYDSSVHFYSFSEKMSQIQMLCVTDEPTYLPTIKENLILNLNKHKDKILQILDLIQNNFTTNTCKDSLKIFSALNGAYLIGRGKENAGGKVIIFSSSNILTQSPKLNGGLKENPTKEEIAYTTHDKRQLGTMGINLTNENMSCDIFCSAETHIKILTLNQLCEYSNGNIYFYKNFNIDLHYKNIFNQIRRVLSRPICWEGVLRTRFSHGYKIANYLTPVLISKEDLFIYPVGDSDQHVTIGLEFIKENLTNNQNNNLDYNNDNNNFVYIQSALLYSYGDGQRRIRIHNLCIPLSNNANDIFNNINCEILSAYYLKKTIDKIYKDKNIPNAISSTETSFKTFISIVLNNQQSMKKVLPENLNFLPIYILGMIKQRVFCKDEIDKKYDIDLSNFLRIKLQRMSYEEILSYIYPNIYPIHNLMTDKSLGTYNEEGILNMPQIIGTSINSFEPNGLYLIDNGYLLIIYVKTNCDKEILKSLFEVEDLQFLTINVKEDIIFEKMDEFKERIMNIIDYIRATKSLYQNLIFVFEGTNTERIIKESLIEDNFCNWYPYDYTNFYNKCVNDGFRGGYK